MKDNTNPEENLKLQNYFKIGMGLVLLISIFIYKAFFSSNESENENISEKIRIYEEDDFVQTKYAGQIEPELNEIRDSIKMMKEENEKLREENKKLQYQNTNKDSQNRNVKNDKNINDLYGNFPKPPSYKQNDTSNSNPIFTNKIPTFETIRVTEISDSIKIEEINIDENNSSSSNPNNLKKNKIYIPSGSILKLKLLSKIHANTMSKAASTPVPAIFQITDLAILPNKASLNIRECFIKAEARGSLSSESAYIRSNFLSCVTDSGKIIDSKLNGAAIIPGTVISKQGTLLGYSLIAGFIDGWAKISQNQYTTTMASAIGTTESSTASGGDIYKTAGYSGLSQASSSMSKFYMDMVANLEPVVEVLGGQNIDMMITKGTYLEFKGLKIEKNIMDK